jgi:hypothetical protein
MNMPSGDHCEITRNGSTQTKSYNEMKDDPTRPHGTAILILIVGGLITIYSGAVLINKRKE